MHQIQGLWDIETAENRKRLGDALLPTIPTSSNLGTVAPRAKNREPPLDRVYCSDWVPSIRTEECRAAILG